jgi:hypothetical protein
MAPRFEFRNLLRDPSSAPQTTGAPAANLRLLAAVLMGIACAAYVFMHGRANPDFTSDFDQVWAGARALFQDKDPYVVVGPGREFGWRWPLYYPVPALVIVSPLGLLPVLAARATFAGCSAALLAWAITREGWSRLPIFLSVSFMVTMELGQWSALYAAAFFLPALGLVGMAKPNFGAALGAASSRTSTLTWLLGGAVVLLAISQFLQPGWVASWLANLRAAPHFKPHVLRPLGFLLLLATLKWRRPEARWLLALAVVPQAPSFYDQLLLAVVCLTSREALIFAVSTVVLFFYVGFNTPQPDYESWGRLVGNGTLWICYFPALVMVMRRPNEGSLPPFVERVLGRLSARRTT